MAEPKNAAAARRQRGRPRAFDDKTEQNTIKALDRALTVLEELAKMEGATLSSVAHALDEAPATIYRILVTMQSHRIVELDESAQTWHVGPGAFLIGSAFLRRTSLIERARPVLRDLMQKTGETANLGVESDGAVLFVSQVETHAAIRAFFPPGTKSPLHASGIGKVLLAERIGRLPADLPRYTSSTITEPEALRAELDEIRERGYAIDNEERTEGMRCVAAPIRDTFSETIAGISVSGPVSRMTLERAQDFAAPVIAAAEAISLALGARVTRPRGD